MRAIVQKDLVLVADDESTIRTVVSRQLVKSGFKVEAFASGKELLARTETICPGVIVSDLKMPGMSGIELLAAIRERFGAEVPAFVIITAYGEFDSARDALRKGAYDFISKPFDLGEFVHTVRRAAHEVDLHLTRRTLIDVLIEDLLSPLGAVRMNMEALAGELTDGLSADQQELIRLSRDGCARMHRLVENLQELALIERGELLDQRRDVDASALAREVAQPFGASVEADGEVLAHVDPTILARVIRNLLIAATSGGGSPGVEVRRGGDGGASVRVAPLPDPLGPGEPPGVLLTPEARPELRRRGVALNAELELSFVDAAAAPLGGRLSLERSDGHLAATVTLRGPQA